MEPVSEERSLFDEKRLSLLTQEPPENPMERYRFRLRQKSQVKEYLTELIHQVKEAGPEGQEVLDKGLRFLFDEMAKGSSWSVLYDVGDTFSRLYREFPACRKKVLSLLEEYRKNGQLDDKTFTDIKQETSL